MHEELKKAIEENDYAKINKFLNTSHYDQDSETTRIRSDQAFIQGWKECERLMINKEP